MTDAARRASNWRRRLPGLTALNESTSARYSACDGQHVPSGDTVTRYFPGGDRVLKVCAVCECPFGGPKIGWTTNPMGRAYTNGKGS